MKELKTNKKRDAQKKRPSNKVRVVSLEAGRESVVGKICERGRVWDESERERWEWWVDRVRRCGMSMNRQVRDRDWN